MWLLSTLDDDEKNTVVITDRNLRRRNPTRDVSTLDLDEKDKLTFSELMSNGFERHSDFKSLRP